MKLSYLSLFISTVCVYSNAVCAEKLPANPWLTDTIKSSVNNNTKALQKVQETTVTATDAVLDSAPANPWTNKSESSDASLRNVHDQLVDTFETSAQNVRDLAKRAQDIKQSADTINRLQDAADSGGQMPSGEQLSSLMNNVKKMVADGNNNEDDSSASNESWFQNLNNNLEQQKSSMSTISKAAQEYRKTTDSYKRQLNSKYNATRRKIKSYTDAAHRAVENIEKNSGIDPKTIQKMMK